MSNEEKLALEKRAPALKLAIEAKNKEVAGKISHAHAEADRSLGNSLALYAYAGLLMIERKEDLPHGEFGRWLQKYCPEITWASACNHVNVARVAVAKVLGEDCAKGEISNRLKFDGAALHDVLVADPATLTKAARDVQSQFRDFFHGKTQHQLLLDWKEIRAKAKPERKAAPSAEELAKAEAAQADANLKQLVADIEHFVLQGDTLLLASDAAKKALLEKGIEMNGRLREAIAKAQKPVRKSKRASLPAAALALIASFFVWSICYS